MQYGNGLFTVCCCQNFCSAVGLCSIVRIRLVLVSLSGTAKRTDVARGDYQGPLAPAGPLLSSQPEYHHLRILIPKPSSSSIVPAWWCLTGKQEDGGEQEGDWRWGGVVSLFTHLWRQQRAEAGTAHAHWCAPHFGARSTERMRFIRRDFSQSPIVSLWRYIGAGKLLQIALLSLMNLLLLLDIRYNTAIILSHMLVRHSTAAAVFLTYDLFWCSTSLFRKECPCWISYCHIGFSIVNERIKTKTLVLISSHNHYYQICLQKYYIFTFITIVIVYDYSRIGLTDRCQSCHQKVYKDFEWV